MTGRPQLRSVWTVAAARLQAVPPYVRGAAAATPAGKLSSNESALGPSPLAIEAIRRAAEGVHRYPDEADLRSAIAERNSVPADHVVVTNGSDELCYLLARVVLDVPGARAVTSVPAYAIDVSVSALVGAEVVPIPLRNYRHDLDALSAASSGAQILWLPSPHNPTGAAVCPRDLRLFLDRVDPGCVVVIDEAYRDFADPSLRPDVGKLLDQHPNLVVQRTLSKSYGLAGLRVGYGIARPEAIELLYKARAPFSVNSIGVAAATAALGDDEWRRASVAYTVRERKRLEDFLDASGVQFIPSEANFVTARIAHSSVADALHAAGLTVRPGESLGMSGWIRISIGAADVMDKLFEIISAALDAEPSRRERTTSNRSNQCQEQA